MKNKRKVLVFGATGQQGGGVVKELLSHGHDVIGLTRNPDSDSAKVLATSGVDVRKGDFTAIDELVSIMKEVDTVFAMTTPFEKGVDHEAEQGIATVDAAAKAGVGHFVFSSVASADKATGIPHFDSKYKVEEHLKGSGMNYTIVAPVFFMNNLVSPWTIDTIKTGKISAAMPGSRLLQQIDSADIARFVAAVVEGRERFFGRRIDIAGDELTGDQMAQIVSEVTGKTFVYEGFDPNYIRETSEDMALMYEWFDKVGYAADVEALKADFPDVKVTGFKEFVAGLDWGFLA